MEPSILRGRELARIELEEASNVPSFPKRQAPCEEIDSFFLLCSSGPAYPASESPVPPTLISEFSEF